MKPFTFMTVVLGLVLGFLFASGRHAIVPNPAGPVLVQAEFVPGPHASDDEDDDRREAAEGLPVRIVPGTRVSEAEVSPPKVSRPRESAGRKSDEQRQRQRHPVADTRRIGPDGRPIGPRLKPRPQERAPSPIRTIAGRLSATEERARDDARLQLEREVTEWLTPDVPTQWNPPGPLITGMILKNEIKPIARDYGTVYEATLEADFSTARRDEIRAAYQRELVARRLTILGGILGFVMVCLAAVAGYIRTDEATKGYYTHWLRAIAAAGVGASGVLIYQLLT
jgi:hypothetical protein